MAFALLALAAQRLTKKSRAHIRPLLLAVVCPVLLLIAEVFVMEPRLDPQRVDNWVVPIGVLLVSLGGLMYFNVVVVKESWLTAREIASSKVRKFRVKSQRGGRMSV